MVSLLKLICKKGWGFYAPALPARLKSMIGLTQRESLLI